MDQSNRENGANVRIKNEDVKMDESPKRTKSLRSRWKMLKQYEISRHLSKAVGNDGDINFSNPQQVHEGYASEYCKALTLA